jgi:hypothetical protein
MTAHQKELGWMGLAHAFGTSLYDALSLQTEAMANDTLNYVRSLVGRLVIGVVVFILLLCTVLFASLSVASLVAPQHGWPTALAAVAGANLVSSGLILAVRKILASGTLTPFANTQRVFCTLRDSLVQASPDQARSESSVNDKQP